MGRRTYGSMLAALALAGALSACGGDGPGGSSVGGVVAPGAAGVTGPWGTQANAPQWQTALAALAGAPSPDPVRIEPAAIAAWNELLRKGWPGLVPVVEEIITQTLQAQVGQSVGGIQLLALRNPVLGLQAPPAFDASAPATSQTFTVKAPPAPASWSISLTAFVGGAVNVSVAGIQAQIPIQVDVTVDVTDIRIEQAIRLDLSDPLDIRFGPPGTPDVHLSLAVSSRTAVVSTVASALTQLLDPIVRAGLVAGAYALQGQVGALLAGLPQGPSWGLGGAGVQPTQGAPALQPLAERIGDEIRTNHTPWGQVYPAIFDSPQGTQVVRWVHHGDAAIWTGHYLAGEAYRYDVTSDTRAFDGARKAIDGIRLLLDVARPGDGLLSRAAIPVSSPRHQDIGLGAHTFHAAVNGVTYRAIGNISRDQYIGVMLGLGQAWHRIPALRPECAQLIGRVVAYLERTGWIAQQPNFIDFSVTFVTAPSAVIAFTKLGALTDPARWQAVHDAYLPAADVIWLAFWLSAREVHESYYKFNLGHSTLVTLLELETDPTRYRAYVRAVQTLRPTIGHHQNAWFDAVHGMANPALRPTMGPVVEDELERWTLRPRRGFTVHHGTNPSIQVATITIQSPSSATTGPSTQITTQPRTKDVAVYPVPIEERPPSNFVWQRSPFNLDGGDPPEQQNSGLGLFLPYWFARSHGLVR